MQIPLRPIPIVLIALLLAACRAEEEPPRPAAADPRPADTLSQAPGTAAAGAVLTTTGQPAFQGSSSFFCVPHAVGGLQVDFRTGNADLPTVAVRIENYAESGPYQARLFVTGRSLSGGLVTSEGEADVEVRQRTPAGGAAVALIDGTFHGRYDGEAGKGAIEGRFGSCSYSPLSGPPSVGGSPPLAGGSTAATDGENGQVAGASEETP